MRLITPSSTLDSPARSTPTTRKPLRIALVQHRWDPNPTTLRNTLIGAIGQGADAGAQLVCLPEITLMKYPADVRATGRPGDAAEDLQNGPTFALAATAAIHNKVTVHASLYQRSDAADGLGLNTAILVSPSGELIGATHKLHIPISAGYYEDTYFRKGPATDPYPVYRPEALAGAALGLPTCWDEWFPELARAYSLNGAEVLIYPTAIGSEPSFPDFDTQPLWEHVIVANGITAGTFMVVPNRVGDEGGLRFYGSSFISDPYGRVNRPRPKGGGSNPGSRPGPGPAPRLAGPLPVQHHPTARHLRRTDQCQPHAVVMSTWMPPETDPQERVWMAFPPAGYTLGDTPAAAHEARTAWTPVAHAVLQFQPVTMIVDPADIATARSYLSAEVEILQAPLDDAWMRDIGPTFVNGHDGPAGIDWTFNGWGQQEWATWDKDANIAEIVLEQADAARILSPIVNEGGGIHVDGHGTVLLTETVQLDPHRNPGATKADIEAELARTIGATHAIWLPRGLTRDAQRFGTRGHVDILATIPSPGVLLVHDQRDPAHPDHAVMHQILAALSNSTDAAGQEWDIRRIPAPQVLTDEEGPVDYSYLNHAVVNDAVIACSFDDPHDAEAVSILQDCYPGRQVITVDARPIFARGGGVHCITQHQPAPTTSGGTANLATT